MSWSSLPLEILQSIFNDDSLNTQDIVRVARVDRRTSRTVSATLYRHVRLSYFTARSSRLTKQFIRTVMESPELTPLVLSLRVDFDRPDEGTNSRINRLIEHLRSLNTLTLHTVGHFNPTFLKNPPPKLHYLNAFEGLSFNDLVSYTALPNVQDLTIKCSWETDPERSKILPHVCDQPFLTVFDIRIHITDVPWLIRQLSCCPALTSFTCLTLAGCATSPPIPAATLCQALDRCSETLVNLDIDLFNPTRHSVDASMFNLSSFKNLKTLRAHCCFLFSERERYYFSARKAICQRLPPSLESLEIVFYKESSAFVSRPEHSRLFPDVFPSCREYLPENSEWVIGIPTHLTRLNRLGLVEHARHGSTPVAIRRALKAANIESHISARSPDCPHSED